MRNLFALVFVSFIVSGCYLSHERPSFPADGGSGTDDGGAVFEDASVDAGLPPSDFFFCDPYHWGGITDDSYGYAGCCTHGAFPTADHVEPGMLMKGSGNMIYYIAADGSRYVFPSSHFLTSWYLDSSRPVPFGEDDHVCSLVVQITDELLASIPIAGNVPMRPGIVITGITTDPKRYVIDHGNKLRWIDDPSIDLHFAEPWLEGRDIHTPDAFFVNFCIGASLAGDPVPYDGDRLYREASIQGEIDRNCGS